METKGHAMHYDKVESTEYKVTMTKDAKRHTYTFDHWDKVIDEIQEFVDEKKEEGWYFAGCEKVQHVRRVEHLWF